MYFEHLLKTRLHVMNLTKHLQRFRNDAVKK